MSASNDKINGPVCEPNVANGPQPMRLGKNSALHARPRHAPIKFYTIAQVADCVGVSTRTVRRWVTSHVLPVHRIEAVVRVSDADLTAFLAARREV